MKLTTLLMILGCLQLNAAVFSQTINLSERNVSLESVFSKMEEQTGYTFFSKLELVRAMPNVNVNFKNATLSEALDQLLSKLSLSYSIVGKTVVIKPKTEVSYNIKPMQPVIYVGKVLDEYNEPLAGVSIKIKGTNQGTVTNRNGQFTTPIISDPKAILQISYVGYISQEIPVSDLKSPIIIKLKVASSDLDQVQITAYGTTTKRISTGNIGTITAKEIEKSPARNVMEIIQGKVPGLFIQQQSGLPGTPFDVTIRGQQSFGDSSPLIIVDGVALPSGKLPIYYGSSGNENLPDRLKGGNPLDFIDPSNIESVNVLKDADATAIYGSRGAYGVILITTKKGKSGTPRFNINASTGITVRGTSPQLLNTEQYLMLRNEGKKNDGASILATDNDLNGKWSQDSFTDWQEVFAGKNATVNKINGSYSGGTGDINFLIGGNYRQQNSVQIGSGSTRDGGLNFNINNNTKNNKFSINLSGAYSSTTDDATPYDFSQSSYFITPPNAPSFYLPDGSLNWTDWSNNPVAAANIIYKNITNNLTSNLGLKYTPVKGLSFSMNAGFNVISSKELRAQPSTYYNPATVFKTTSTLNLYNIRNITVEPSVSYTTPLGKKGTLNLQTGGTLENQLTYSTYTTGNDFISDAMVYNPSFADALTSTGAVNVTTNYNQIPNKYLGFFGIANYNWDNKYIVNINGRYDGSTKFGKDHQLGLFGSVGAAWIISSESWFKALSPIVSFAKLRGSYGITGGDNIGNYAYISTYYKNSTLYQGNLGLYSGNLANPDIHWEKNKQTEGGLDLQFLNGRIDFDVSYFVKEASDQLVNQLLPSTTGFAGRILNSPAIIKNWGYEFNLNTRNITTKNFSWNSSLAFTLPKNRLVAYPGIENTTTNYNYVLGKPIYGIRVFNYAGVDPETGLYNFINREGVKGTYRLLTDPTTLDADLDRTEFIDLTPKYYGSFSNSFTYKGISVDFQFSFTNRMGKNFLGSQTFSPGQMFNMSVVALDRWQKPGDVTDVPKASANLGALFMQNNFTNSTGAYSRATYARLQYLNISYAFPAELIQRFHLRALSVNVQGSNLLTISKFGDLDPENLGAGMAPLRFFTAGFKITL